MRTFIRRTSRIVSVPRRIRKCSMSGVQGLLRRSGGTCGLGIMFMQWQRPIQMPCSVPSLQRFAQILNAIRQQRSTLTFVRRGKRRFRKHCMHAWATYFGWMYGDIYRSKSPWNDTDKLETCQPSRLFPVSCIVTVMCLAHSVVLCHNEN
jgi:hypothetical protein